MRGFLLGLLVAGLVFAGYLGWTRYRSAPSGHQQAQHSTDAGAPGKKKRRRGRGAVRLARAGDRGGRPEGEPEPEPVHLSPADLRMLAQGDDLNRPDVIRMDFADVKETRELTQEDIDVLFRPQEGAILDCISSSRPDPDSYVPGRVTIKFRIQRAGTVRGVRVEAPAVLQRGGLYECVKRVVAGLRFPAAGSSQVVMYPFSLS